MISEHKFSSHYTSFWRTALPLGDAFVRHMNGKLEKFAEPVEFDTPADRSALLSEASFRLLCRGGPRELRASMKHDSLTITEAAVEAAQYLSHLKGSYLLGHQLSKTEEEIVLSIAQRLRMFFVIAEGEEELLLRPIFEGCGFVSRCEGDILAGTILYEIKNVERSFRLVDIRQILTYCALNYARELHQISGVGWVNARSGKFYRIGLDVLAMRIAGCPASELLSEIVNFVSSDQHST